MADFNEETIRRLEAEFNRGQMSASQFATALSALNAQIGRSRQQAGDLAGALNRAAQGSRSQGAAAAALAADLKRAAQSARASSATSEEARRKYEEQVSQLVSQIGDRELRANIRRFSEGAFNAAGSAEAFNRVLAFASKPMNSLGSIFSSYQQQSGQIGTAGTVLREGASLAGSGLTSFGNALQSASLGLGVLAKSLQGRIIAGAIGGLGTIFSGMGEALKKVSERVLPTLQAEIEKNIGAFQHLSSVGATYGEGLQSMINASGHAGLTLEQFAKIVVTNKDSLAGTGLGVSEASNVMARSLNQGGTELRKRLLNLGYTIEEHGGLVAETMRRMTQSGERIDPNNRAQISQITEQTQKYAENLRIIAQITGEDAKQKMAEAQSAANELAFQQKLAGMDAKQRDEVIQAMAAMSPLMRKAYQETVVFGQAITPAVAAALQQSESMQQSLQETVAAHEAGTLTARKQLEINAQYGDRVKDDLLGNEAIARAGMAGVGGIVGDIKAAMQDELQYRIKWNKDAIQNAIERTQNQARPEAMQEGAGDLQKSMTDLIIGNQNLNVQMQKTVFTTGVLNAYMAAANFAVKEFTEALTSFTNLWPSYQRDREQQQAREDAAQARVGQIPRGAPITPEQVPEQIRLRERELDALQRMPQRQGGDLSRRAEELQRQINSLRTTGALPDETGRTPTPVLPNQQQPTQQLPPTTPDQQRPGQPSQQQPNQQTPGPQTNARPASAVPTANMSTESLYRQARTLYGAPTQQEQQAETARQVQERQAIDEQSERQAAQERAVQQQRQAAARTDTNNNDSRTLQQLADTMNAVQDTLATSLRHLSRIEDYTRQTATG